MQRPPMGSKVGALHSGLQGIRSGFSQTRVHQPEQLRMHDGGAVKDPDHVSARALTREIKDLRPPKLAAVHDDGDDPRMPRHGPPRRSQCRGVILRHNGDHLMAGVLLVR